MPKQENKISILDGMYIAKSGLNKREVQNNYDTGHSRWDGFSDPNRQLSPYDLFGYSNQTAIYDEMSKASPTIAQGLRKIADTISNLKVDIVPANNSLEAIMAAERCKQVLTNMPNQSLRSWIWDVVYHTATNGHSLHEIVVDENDNLKLYRVRSNTIYAFESQAGEYTGAKITTQSSHVTLPANKSVMISMQDYPGNWWGVSMLRPLLSTYQMYKTSVMNFLSGQRNAKGFLDVQQTGETSNDSWLAIQSFLTDFYNDKESPLIRDAHWDVKFQSIPNPGAQELKDLYERFDATIKEFLFDSINNLGEHGSRALGSEYRMADAQKFAQFVSRWEDLLNGRGADQGSILLRICEYSGFADPSAVCPVFRLSDTSEIDLDAQIASVKTLMDAGLITKDDLGTEVIYEILTKIGFDSAILKRRIELKEGDMEGVDGISRFSNSPDNEEN